MRVLEAGQDLTLVAEAADDAFARVAAIEDLDGDAFLKHVIAANGEIHRAHAAAPDFTDQAVRSDALTGGWFGNLQAGEIAVRRNHDLSVYRH